MTVLAGSQVRSLSEGQTVRTDWQNLCRIGGVAALIQLACTLVVLIVVSLLGAEPATAEEYFTLLNHDRLVGLLRMDFATLTMLALMPLTVVGIYAALRRDHEGYGVLGAVLVLFGTGLSLANHSALSMIYLSSQYSEATASQQAQLLAAANAIIAGDMWHGTAGFLAGIFMQGGFVFLSAVMLRGRLFSRGTAYTGLLANGLDLAHVLVGLVLPSLALLLMGVGGLFYLVWFPLLGRDLLRQAMIS